VTGIEDNRMTHCLSRHAIALLFVAFGLITPCILYASTVNAANLDTPSGHSLAVKNEKGATNTIAEKERIDSEKQAVLDATESWRTAWSAKDQENYFRAYAADFMPAHPSSLPAWKKHKKHLFAIRTYMRVRLGSVNIEILETGRRARARFHQKYDANGYHSVDNKELLLTNKGGGWKIVREHVIPATQNMTRLTRLDQKPVEASKTAKDSPGQNKAESGHSQVETASSAAKIEKQPKEKNRTENQAVRNTPATENKKPHNPFSIRAEADYRRALKLIKEGKNGEALDLLAPYTVAPKNYPEITADYIAVLVWVGKLDKAIEKYEALPEGFPRRGLILTLIRSGKLGKAEVQLETFLLKEPESQALNMVKPGVLAARGKYSQSVHQFRSLLARKDTDRASIYRDRRRLIVSLGTEKQRDMLSQLRREAKQNPEAFSRDYIVALALTRHFNGAVKAFKAEKLAASSFSNYDLSLVAWSYFKIGNIKQSKRYYRQILAADATDTRANIGMSYNLAMEGKEDEAITILDRLLKKQPNNIDVRYARAYIFEKQKKFGLAASEYERILAVAPDAMAARPALVLNLVDAGDADKAARLLSQFRRDNPDYLPLILTRPRVLIGQGKYGMALESYRQLAARPDVNRQAIFRDRDDMITSLPDNKRKALLDSLHRKAQQGDQNALRDFILAQILNGNYKTATKTFEDAGLPHEQYSLNELNWIAWAYFKLGNTEQSKQLYLKALKEDPGLLRARIGMAYNLALEGRMLSEVKKYKESKIKTNEAIVMADELVKDFPNDVEAHFARAYVFEQQGLFWRAIHEYDEVLRIAPENLVAVKLKLMDLSSLGASSIALEELGKKLPGDENLRKSLKGDMVVDSLHWDEFNKAVKMIQPLLTEKKDVRPRFDYIVALAENRDMKQAIDAYQELLDDGISPPSWVLENVGRAYLYLKKPGKALETYDMALELDPRSYNARFGKFYVLQETRKWKNAEKILAKLDREYRWTYWQGKQKQPVPKKLEIAIARGWKLAYEDRLNEAEEYFSDLHRQAPANSEIRSAQAYIYLFRGWPRKALMEFQIIETMDPENLEARIGRVRALNELKFKEEARKEKNAIIYQPGKEYFKRTNVKKLDRDLLLESKFRLGFDFVYEDSTDDSSDYLTRLRLAVPLTLHTDLTAYILRRKTAQLESFGQFDRFGLGIDHTFNSDWRATETVSFDVNQGSEVGSLTELVYTPDDHWRLDASYDTFAVDIALRARAFGIRARKASAGVTYRQSEWREIALGYTHWDFSDKNNREEGLLRYEQGLWVRNDWRQRLFLDYYLARNSLRNRPYFNPRWAWSITGTLMTQQTVWDIYDRKFVHKLFLTGGNYNQSSFGNKGIMIIRYQQEIDFTDTQALLWGVTWSRQPFDGDFVNTRNLYLTYEGKF